ncbi:MAG: hypothetical protein ACE37H_06560 [Phycisphaeraceae bacterium]
MQHAMKQWPVSEACYRHDACGEIVMLPPGWCWVRGLVCCVHVGCDRLAIGVMLMGAIDKTNPQSRERPV